jgi:hypothetical protein
MARPDLPETQALAGTLALAPRRRGPWRAPLAGLGARDLDAVMLSYFPGAAPLRPLLHIWREEAEAQPRPHMDEFDDLVALLLAHQTEDRRIPAGWRTPSPPPAWPRTTSGRTSACPAGSNSMR